jgi:hypothetical protein
MSGLPCFGGFVLRQDGSEQTGKALLDLVATQSVGNGDTLFLRTYQAGFSQHAMVKRHGRGRQVRAAVATAQAGTGRELAHDDAPERIGQGMQQTVKRDVAHSRMVERARHGRIMPGSGHYFDIAEIWENEIDWLP